jgi:CHRD domain/Immunoglobulin domain
VSTFGRYSLATIPEKVSTILAWKDLPNAFADFTGARIAESASSGSTRGFSRTRRSALLWLLGRVKRFPVVALVLLACLATSLIPARATVFQYSVIFNGASESPANSSPGTGTGTVTYNDATHSLQLQVVFGGLLGVTTASRIQAATALPFTGTAGVATTTPNFAGFPIGVSNGSFSNTLDLTLASSYNSTFVAANGGTTAGAEAALAAAMAAGKSYWNINSTAFPGGEIRSFLGPGAQAATYQLDNNSISNIFNASEGTEPLDNWFGNVFTAQADGNVITRVDFGVYTTTPNSAASVVLYRVTDPGGDPALGATRVYTQSFTPLTGDGTNAFIQQIDLSSPVPFIVGDRFLVAVFIANVLAAPPNDVYPFLLDTSGVATGTYWDRSVANTFNLDDLSQARPINQGFVTGGFAPGAGHIIIRAQGVAPPVITQQPQSISITNGQTITLNVTASGAPPLSYQWYYYTNGGSTNLLADGPGPSGSLQVIDLDFSRILICS